MGGHEVIEALPVLAMPEYDRRADQELVAVLLRSNDPVVRDALQRQVLAARGALGGPALVVGSRPFRQVDADPAWLVGRQARVMGEVVLPGGTGVERLRVEFVGADPAYLVQPGNAGLVQELSELFGERGGDTVLLAGRRLVEETRPDAGESGLPCSIVSAEDALALRLVELAAQVLGRQEDNGLDPRDALADVELLRRPVELALELFRLQVGEVQRVLDRPSLAVIFEQPGGTVVSGVSRLALDLDEEQAAGGGDEQVHLADVPVVGGERERLPGAVRLGVAQYLPLMKSRACCSQG